MAKATYTDGFVLAIPKKKIAEYKKLAKLACKIWKEHGAVDYVECVADDVKVKMGVPFPKIAKVKAGEVVVFSWITYKSKADRNKINAKVMKDKRLTGMDPNKMPFDCNRMTYGGFKILVQN